MFKKFSSLILFIILFFNSYLVRAHHPLAGKEMTTFLDGLLSGLGHPILGIDHFFFILGQMFCAWPRDGPPVLFQRIVKDFPASVRDLQQSLDLNLIG